MKVPGKEREDVLIYGVKVTYLKSKNKIKNGVVFCDDDTNLQFLCPDDPDNLIIFNIKIVSISDILSGRSEGYLKDLELPIDNNCCVTIKYNDGLKHVDLIFYSTEICEYFISGLIYMMRKRVKEGQNYNIDYISLKRIWRQYDPQRNKYLDLTQFSQFLKDIKFDKAPEKVFKDICKENNRITFKEFINFYELLVTGEEFEEVFQKYSKDENKKYITIKGLIEFFDKEQNEILYPEDAIKLICKYSSKAKNMHESTLKIIQSLIKKKELKTNRKKNQNPNNSETENFDENISNIMNILTSDLFKMRYRPPKLSNNEMTESESLLKDYENHTLNKSKQIDDYMNILNNEYKDIKSKLKDALRLSFRKFVNLLMDHTVNNIFNKDKISRNQDMDHPMTDYFVNSSHNTYLEGNQIIGSTSISMYLYVFDNGTRFVDLDTFDGKIEEENEPVITHWHFPVGFIPFKDTLIEIKNRAFQKNEYPVILSLENHCGNECQEKMNKYFLEIIGRENLYILDNDTPPLLYPSPNQLKKKFIIKNKRKRILGDLGKMQNVYEKNYMNTLEEINKKNQNQKNELINNTNSDISLAENDNNENSINKSLKKSKYLNNEILGMSMTPNDNTNINNNNANKNYNIISEIIEEVENSSESHSSDSGDISSEKADEKIIKESGECVNEIRCNKYTFMKELPNNPNFILCRNSELEILPENKNILPKKKSKKPKIKPNDEKYEHPRIVPLSNLLLKKMREKFDTIESLPPNESVLELEQKYKNLKKIQDIQIGDTKNSNNIKIITIENLANILGMVGVKYHKETFDPKRFLPWECISIAENDILKYISVPENKFKIMEYCTSSFLKVYPDGFRTDSSNQDVVNFWALGCQFCALNLQKTDDDCVLINKMFFKLNGGSKCGYVLKPVWLRKFNEDNFKKRKLNPIFKIKFEILSGFHLNLTIPNDTKVKGMFVEVTLRSPNSFFLRANEEEEKKLTTNIINKNFLHPVFPSNSITFNIYEEELSFIFIKLLSENRDICLGRAAIPVVALNLGYRVVDLYDNTCTKLDEPFLIVRSNKIL